MIVTAQSRDVQKREAEQKLSGALCRRPDCCLGKMLKTLEHWAGKFPEHSELSGLFCGNLDNRSEENEAENGGLVGEVFRGSRAMAGAGEMAHW